MSFEPNPVFPVFVGEKKMVGTVFRVHLQGANLLGKCLFTMGTDDIEVTLDDFFIVQQRKCLFIMGTDDFEVRPVGLCKVRWHRISCRFMTKYLFAMGTDDFGDTQDGLCKVTLFQGEALDLTPDGFQIPPDRSPKTTRCGHRPGNVIKAAV
ncbi:MAG: hypothetical protein HQL77_16580 [Magnetococcales bacterium]|nr:hypothetical protein [Magnetococcales bacterium]